MWLNWCVGVQRLKFFADLNNVLTFLVVGLLMAFAIPAIITPRVVETSGFYWNLLAVATAAEYFVFILELRL
jgi:hypothetical protein